MIIGIYIDKKFNGFRIENTDIYSIDSETVWAIELAKHFGKKHTVYLFCGSNFINSTPYNVTLVPYKKIHQYSRNIIFDVFITTHAIINTDDNIKANRIYYAPSLFLIDNYIHPNNLDLDKIHKIAYLSDFHKNFMKQMYNIQDDGFFFKHEYSINYKLYDSVDFNQKRNIMVWSSLYRKGLHFFIKDVFPRIKERIPDFELYIMSHSHDYCVDRNWKNIDGVKILDFVNKKRLSQLQKKAKIWVYPNFGIDAYGTYFKEVFCLTAIENAASGNAIVCFGGKDGLSDTLNGYSGLLDGSFFDEFNYISQDDFTNIINVFTEKTIEILTNDEYRMSLVRELDIIKNRYSWENCFKAWDDEILSEK